MKRRAAADVRHFSIETNLGYLTRNVHVHRQAPNDTQPAHDGGAAFEDKGNPGIGEPAQQFESKNTLFQLNWVNGGDIARLCEKPCFRKTFTINRLHVNDIP